MADPRFELFHGLSPEVTSRLTHALVARQFAAGEVLIRENQPNDRLFLVETGSLAVWKGEPGSPRGVCLATLEPGACFGEMSALNAAPASATVLASAPATVRELNLRDLPAEGPVRETVALNLARTLVARLSQATVSLQAKHAAQLEAMRLLVSASSFLTRMMIALAFYMFALPLVSSVRPLLSSDTVISSFFVVAFFGVSWNFLRRSQLDPAEFGMTLRDWPRQLGRSFAWSSPFLVGFFLLKCLLAWWRPEEIRVFEPMRLLNSMGQTSFSQWVFFSVVYVSLCFAQEFIRCAVQGSLAIFYRASGRPARWRSILVANVVFASLHVHLGNSFALLAFVPGLFWGWLYARENSFLAVAFSHGLIGLWIVCVVGVPA
ncbi:MAG: cyclic nucleotide-binding domain-containing protein [Verrucomicrobia bacterium]|nr:cyclic nucleotide-binding domain-containing protein [Verrucomicrobiota bacterium]